MKLPYTEGILKSRLALLSVVENHLRNTLNLFRASSSLIDLISCVTLFLEVMTS